MATEEHNIGTYREFADNILPYIAENNYNVVQLMVRFFVILIPLEQPLESRNIQNFLSL